MCDNLIEQKKKHMLEIIPDLIANYLYYDRKDDDELNRDEVAELLESGYLTIDELVKKFEESIKEAIFENFDLYYVQDIEGNHGQLAEVAKKKIDLRNLEA